MRLVCCEMIAAVACFLTAMCGNGEFKLVTSLAKVGNSCNLVDVLVRNDGRRQVNVRAQFGPADYGVQFFSDCAECFVDREVRVSPMGRWDTLRLYPMTIGGQRLRLSDYYEMNQRKFRIWAVIDLVEYSAEKNKIHLVSDTIECGH